MSIVAPGSSPEDEPHVMVKYRRVSTRDQLEGCGLEDQDELCSGWLGAHEGVVLAGDYVDGAVSGSLDGRPAMARLMRDARGGGFQHILVASVDRVGRTARAAYQWAWDMADLGVHFIAVREGIDTSTESGWAEFRRHVVFAEMEWRRIRERTVAGREAKVSYGGWPAGPAPYGYRIVSDVVETETGRKRLSVLVTDDHEAMVLTVAAVLLVDDDMNCAQAAAELNRRGLLTRSGRPWCAANLRSRLSSETLHKGYVTYRKLSGGSRTRTAESGDPYYGAPVRIGVPPVLGEGRARELWESLRRTGFQNGRRQDRVYPLSGRITGECGETFTGATEGDDARRVYRCRGRLSGACRELNLRADEFESAVLEELFVILRQPVTDLSVVHEAGQREAETGDRDRYERRVAEFSEAIARQEDLLLTKVPEYLAAGVDPAFLQASIVSAQEQLTDLRCQRAVAAEWLAVRAEQDRLKADLRDVVAAGPEVVPRLTAVQAARLCDAYGVKVVLVAQGQERKAGVRCPVTEWHRETGNLVPPDPTDEEWEAVVAAVRPLFAKKHFTSKYDIRKQFDWMLHRLRTGLAWVDMPLERGQREAVRARQLAWWQRGAWPRVMEILGAGLRGDPAHRRMTLPAFRLVTLLSGGAEEAGGDTGASRGRAA
ncbi:recombinase family protein [Streptomyces sp. NPDC050400]|uniref:recombinase family protein n=1 Tax=Streptomyces sp. NPDC050400 TaxID=3365610 RepID=UPI0037BDC90B